MRDLLDKKVLDRYGREMGRVDSVVIDTESGGATVVAIEIGSAVLARRVAGFVGRFAASLERALGIDEGRPVRIPFSAIVDIGHHVRVDAVFGELPVSEVEHRLRHLVGSLPGGSS